MSDANMILWMPASVWLQGATARLRAISDAQQYLHDRKPENYGVITAVLSSMLFAVGNSPKALPLYTREALSALRMESVTHRFGMFFLQNLDMNLASALHRFVITSTY